MTRPPCTTIAASTCPAMSASLLTVFRMGNNRTPAVKKTSIRASTDRQKINPPDFPLALPWPHAHLPNGWKRSLPAPAELTTCASAAFSPLLLLSSSSPGAQAAPAGRRWQPPKRPFSARRLPIGGVSRQTTISPSDAAPSARSTRPSSRPSKPPMGESRGERHDAEDPYRLRRVCARYRTWHHDAAFSGAGTTRRTAVRLDLVEPCVCWRSAKILLTQRPPPGDRRMCDGDRNDRVRPTGKRRRLPHRPPARPPVFEHGQRPEYRGRARRSRSRARLREPGDPARYHRRGRVQRFPPRHLQPGHGGAARRGYRRLRHRHGARLARNPPRHQHHPHPLTSTHPAGAPETGAHRLRNSARPAFTPHDD